MSQDFFASVSAIGSQTAVQRQTNSSSSAGRPATDAFAQLFAQNQIDAERRREQPIEKPLPPVAPAALATTYDLSAADQPVQDDRPPEAGDVAPPVDDRRLPDDARSENGETHAAKGEATAAAAHERHAERAAARHAAHAAKKDKPVDKTDSEQKDDKLAGSDENADDPTAVAKPAKDGKAGKTTGEKVAKEAKAGDGTDTVATDTSEADALLANAAAGVTAAAETGASVELKAVDLTTAPPLTTTTKTEPATDGLLKGKSGTAIASNIGSLVSANKPADAAVEDESKADGKPEATVAKPALGFSADTAPKSLAKALEILNQTPVQPGAAANPAAEAAIQKAIASFESKRPDGAIKAIATDIKATPGAFAANALLNAAPPGALDLPVQANAPVVAAQQPATLAALPVAIGSRALNGGREFTVHLYPAELGKVEVKLEISDKGEIKAKLTVDRVETLQLLQRDARSLHQALEQAGFKPSDDGVQFSLRQDNGQQTSQRQSSWDGQGRQTNYTSPQTTDQPDATRDVTAAVLAAYARRGNSALDIHV